MAGVTLNNKRLAADVRTLTLGKIKKILEAEYDKSTEPDDYRFQRDLILKLAPTVLPRITELTGEEGEPIKLNIINYGSDPATRVSTETVSAEAPPSAPEV